MQKGDKTWAPFLKRSWSRIQVQIGNLLSGGDLTQTALDREVLSSDPPGNLRRCHVQAPILYASEIVIRTLRIVTVHSS